MNTTGLQITALFRNYLNSAGIGWKACEQIGEKFQAQIEEAAWICTDTGKMFIPLKVAKDPVMLVLFDHAELVDLCNERANCGSWPMPETPADYLMWLEDELETGGDNPLIKDVVHKLHDLGVQPTLPPWTSKGVLYWLKREHPGLMVQLRNWNGFDATWLSIEALNLLFESYECPDNLWVGWVEFSNDYDGKSPAIVLWNKDDPSYKSFTAKNEVS